VASSPAVYRGFFGENELAIPVVDFDGAFISLCIQRRGADTEGILGMSREQERRESCACLGAYVTMSPQRTNLMSSRFLKSRDLIISAGASTPGPSSSTGDQAAVM
jgi:hypothetical protein